MTQSPLWVGQFSRTFKCDWLPGDSPQLHQSFGPLSSLVHTCSWCAVSCVLKLRVLGDHSLDSDPTTTSICPCWNNHTLSSNFCLEIDPPYGVGGTTSSLAESNEQLPPSGHSLLTPQRGDELVYPSMQWQSTILNAPFKMCGTVRIKQTTLSVKHSFESTVLNDANAALFDRPIAGVSNDWGCNWRKIDSFVVHPTVRYLAQFRHCRNSLLALSKTGLNLRWTVACRLHGLKKLPTATFALHQNLLELSVGISIPLAGTVLGTLSSTDCCVPSSLPGTDTTLLDGRRLHPSVLSTSGASLTETSTLKLVQKLFI